MRTYLDAFTAIADVLAELPPEEALKLVSHLYGIKSTLEFLLQDIRPRPVPRERRRGVVVTVGNFRCPECDGAGSHPAGGTCFRCNGEGTVPIEQQPLNESDGHRLPLWQMALCLLEQGSGNDSPEYKSLLKALQCLGFCPESLAVPLPEYED